MAKGTDLTPLIKKATALVKTNTAVSLQEILEALSPKQVSEPAPASVPMPRPITDEQRQAVERFTKVFGSVVPATRRALTETEVSALLDERTTLDKVKKTAEARLGDITRIAHNHLDVIAEQTHTAATALRDKDGHYILEGTIPAPDRDDQFSRETRQGSASLNSAALLALEAAGKITHEQYLAVTTQVRVVDEGKMVAAIKADPTLLKAIAEATVPGTKSTSMYVRKRK